MKSHEYSFTSACSSRSLDEVGRGVARRVRRPQAPDGDVPGEGVRGEDLDAHVKAGDLAQLPLDERGEEEHPPQRRQREEPKPGKGPSSRLRSGKILGDEDDRGLARLEVDLRRPRDEHVLSHAEQPVSGW